MADFLRFVPVIRETVNTIRARMDGDANAGISESDSRWLDLTEGGIYYDLTQVSALEAERLYDLVNEMVAAIFPQYAWGLYLDEHGVMLDLPRKDAVKATGEIVFVGDVGALIASGTRVATTQPDPNHDPVEFVITEPATLAAQPAPTGVSATPGTAPGVLKPATYYYKVTAIIPAGETAGSQEVSATIPAQFLASPSGLAATPFTSGGSLATGTYFYKVTALNANGETIASNEVSAAVTGPTGRVDLSWTTVVGAASYRIYRGTAANGQNVYYTSATNSFSDTGAANTAGTPPAQNSAQVGQVTLNWSAVAGATAYKVYRSVVTEAEVLLETLGNVLTYTDDGDLIPAGAAPPTNTVSIEAVEAGAAGNVAVGTITQLLSGVQGVQSLSNPAPTSGGADEESDALYRDRILLEYAAPHGAGNIADYQRLGLAYPPIGHVTVEPIWNGAGTVRLIVTDQANDPVSATVTAGLQTSLDPVPAEGRGQAPIGAVVTVITPTITTINVSATVVLASGYSLDGAGGTIPTRAFITEAIRAYVNSLAPGDDVVRERVIASIMAVEGVYDVTATTLNGSATNVVLPPTQIGKMGTVTLA
jgi:uncharacterized phage protein gp47/JayE